MQSVIGTFGRNLRYDTSAMMCVSASSMKCRSGHCPKTCFVKTMATVVVNPKERVVQETLEAVTWPGEVLLGFTVCRHNPGEFLDKEYYVGLTQRRFLLVRKGQPERIYTIYRSYIDQVVYTRWGLFKQPCIEIHLGGDIFRLEMIQPWHQRAMQMAEKHATWELESPYLTATQFLDGMTDLADLGMLRPAQALLRKHKAEDPVVEIEPRTEELDFQITQGRWSLWMTLIMLAIALVYIIGRMGWGAAWAGSGLLPVILMVLAGVELVRRQQTWRGLALGFTLLAALINLAYSGVSGSLVSGLEWAAFGAASCVALTGKTSRPRNLTATAIFTLGFLIPLLVSGIIIAATPPVRFSDDFSTNQGWINRDSQNLTSGIEDGAYAIHVKDSNETFFAFPPITFTPARVRFDASIPMNFKGKVGTYGVTCGYQDAGVVYLVEIDPVGSQFSFLRQDEEQSVPLHDGYWRPLTGVQAGEAMTQVEVQCADKGMSLTVNGISQGQSRAGDLSPDGRIGLFVRTWPETGQGGFKVLFDNIVFLAGGAK